jgi:peroxiredoxin
MLSKNSSLKQSFTSGGLLVVLGLLLLQTNFSYAQSYHDSLRGTLTYGSGKALADAALTLVNEQTNVSRVTVTNEASEYVEITPAADGSLELLQAGGDPRQGNLVAYHPDVARANGVPEPASFTTHTTVRDPKEPFKFSFPDTNGKLVSNTDERFKNKVIIAVVTGTWRPNCHDEAQYLVQLHKKYRDKGLEIVALDFEEPEQQDELARAKAFINKYGVEYPYLIAGAPAEMWEKVPQAVNLNTWPATFFIGRDGLVKLIHSGFAAPASGEFHRQLKEEFTATVERLLAEEVASNTGSSAKGGQR